jgi:hypothetical protein
VCLAYHEQPRKKAYDLENLPKGMADGSKAEFGLQTICFVGEVEGTTEPVPVGRRTEVDLGMYTLSSRNWGTVSTTSILHMLSRQVMMLQGWPAKTICGIEEGTER